MPAARPNAGRIQILGATACLFLLAGCLQPPPLHISNGTAADDSQPNPLGTGNTWEYERAYPNQTARETVVQEADNFETIRGIPTVHIATRITTSSGAFVANENLWLRTSDGAAVLWNRTEQGQGGTFGKMQPFDPPCLLLPIPPKANDTYQEECHIRSGSFNATLFLGYIVNGHETVTVPAGTFQAWNVTKLGAPHGPSGRISVWYSQEACGIVKEQSALYTMVLTSYHCA